MSYHKIELPIDLRWREVPDKSYFFDKLTKEELRSYYHWFQNVMPERRQRLEQIVRESLGFEHWNADYSPDSLSRLDEWLTLQVATSQLSESERLKVRQFTIDYVEDTALDLTDRTYSLVMDIAMYFGEVVRQNYPGARWEQELSSRRNVNFGQPVVVGDSDVPLEPVRVVTNIAYGIAKRKEKRRTLRRLFDVWIDSLSGKTPM